MREKIQYFIIFLFMSIVFTIGYCMNLMGLDNLAFHFMMICCCGLLVYNLINWFSFMKNKQYKNRIESLVDLYIDILIPVSIFAVYSFTCPMFEFKVFEIVTYCLYLISISIFHSFTIFKSKKIFTFVFGGGFTVLVYLVNNLYRYFVFSNLFSYLELLLMDLKYGVGRYVFVFLVYITVQCLIKHKNIFDQWLFKVYEFLYKDLKN